MSLYKEKIIEHYQQPLNNFKPANYSHTAKVENLSCGDAVEVFLTLKDEIITAVNHLSEGCAITVATASMLSEHLTGKSVDELENLNLTGLESLLGMELAPARQDCALIALQAVQDALKTSTM